MRKFTRKALSCKYHKDLTTYLTILNCKMDEKVTFSKEAVKESSDGSSSIKRDVGEEMTMEQTL